MSGRAGINIYTRTNVYATQNVESARLILDRSAEFGGPESGLVLWAEMIRRLRRARLRRTA
jgi:hypothetical protein